MPGLTLAICTVKDAVPRLRFQAACAAMRHAADFREHLFLDTPDVRAGYVAYPEYPIDTFSAGSLVVYVEGKVYDKPAETVRREIEGLGAALQRDTAVGTARVHDWILDSDGDFVVACVDVANRWAAVWTDYLGRLPVYWYRDDTRLLVSREAKFIQRLVPAPALDPVAAATSLHFFYPIGDRTLFAGVRRMPAAGFLRVALDDPPPSEPRALHTLNFDCENPTKPLSQHADEFADLLVETCRAYGRSGGTNILSLSGGYDSRVVGAAYRMAGIDLVATTFRNTAIQRARETDTARRIASALDLPWTCVDLEPAGVEDSERLTALKDGLNAIDNAYILEYLRALVSRWGRGATYVTGDGGGYVFKTTAPGDDFGSVEAVVEWISRDSTFTPLETAAALMHLHPDDLRHEIHRMVASFPEARLAKRAMHWRVLERGRKMNFEGEDRTRFYLWQTAPLYARPVFMHCMQVPDQLKRWKRFVAACVTRLSPATARVPVEPLGIAPASPLHSLAYRTRDVIERLPRPVRNATRRAMRRWGAEGAVRVAGPVAADDPIRAYFRTHIDPGHALWNVVDRNLTATLLETGTWADLIPLATLLILGKRELDLAAGGVADGARQRAGGS